MQLDLLLTQLDDVNVKFNKIWNMISLPSLEAELHDLDLEMQKEENWESHTLRDLQKRATFLRKEIQTLIDLKNKVDNSNDLYLLLKEEEDKDLVIELSEEIKVILDLLEKKELHLLLNDKFDKEGCYLSINAGAGGTESNDWVAMLSRMFLRWANSHSFSTSIIEEVQGDEAGIKNITIYINGDYAYGYLKGEQGVHRLVRISPFDTNKKRHTSFASVAVTPEILDDIDVQINPSDLRIDTYRASGAGGQHVNKTDSAVRIVHKPSGITVACQQERSQHKNKEKALNILKSKLYQFYEEEKKQELKNIEGEKKDIAWGSQIRSYVFQPYQLVKDSRTSLEVGNLNKVMDGDLDPFIFHYLKWEFQKKAL